jgi:hypothetical protein
LKGFVFTLDALFALIVATSTLSLLLYFNFYLQPSIAIGSSEASSILNVLASTNFNSSTFNSQPVQIGLNQNNIWLQAMSNNNGNGYSNSGPSTPLLAYSINAPTLISSQILAAYGMLYFTTGTYVYAYNSTEGTFSWSKNTISSPTGIVLYDGSLIYTNSSSMQALNAFTGNVIWSILLPTTPSLTGVHTQLKEYNGQIIFGTSGNYVAGFSAVTGNFLWNSTNVNSAPVSIAEIGGSIAVLAQQSLSLLSISGSAAPKIWNKSVSSISNNLVSYGNNLFYGQASNAYSLYINGSLVWPSPPSLSSQVYGIASRNGYIIYQSSNKLTALLKSGSQAWQFSAPSYIGTAISNASPVIGGNNVYSIWSNGYIVSQSIINGNVQWETKIPYAGPYGQLSLAYGDLYLSAGNKILAFGACPVSNGSALYQASELYLNGFNSCGSYILNSVYPLKNYTLMINNNYLPGSSALNLSSGNYAFIKGNSSIDSNAYTWSIWIKPFAWSAGNAGIIGQNSTSPGAAYLIEQGSSSSPIIQFSNNGGISSYSVYGSNAVNMNKWQNIIVEYDYISGKMAMYINGVEQQSVSNPITLRRSNNPIYIGMNLVYSSSSFNGLIANLQMYNQSLSQSQIYNIYDAGLLAGPLQDAGLTGWYPLGNDINDYSGMSNTGYLYGGHYSSSNYTTLGLSNAFQVSRAATVMALTNYTNGKSGLYNVSVITWK